jgi:hypothetical protein
MKSLRPHSAVYIAILSVTLLGGTVYGMAKSSKKKKVNWKNEIHVSFPRNYEDKVANLEKFRDALRHSSKFDPSDPGNAKRKHYLFWRTADGQTVKLRGGLEPTDMDPGDKALYVAQRVAFDSVDKLADFAEEAAK